MGKVLIVSPNFPPKNTADLHRVRTSLPYFRKFGWTPTVLCVSPEYCEGIDDPSLTQSVPPDIEVIRVPAWRQSISRKFGFGLLDYRALFSLYRAGNRLLAGSRFDVVYFSTTVFLTFILGPVWKRRFGCKIVYDFQDPWYLETSPYTAKNAPGGWLKYKVTQVLAKYLEPVALRSADHIVSVSEGYVRMLRKRYAWMPASRFSVIPFGAAPRDYELAAQLGARAAASAADDRPVIWVSAGRAGPDMDPILTVFFRKLFALRQQEPLFASRLRVHFVGTNYAPAGRSVKLVESLARENGVDDIVAEQSERIPYLETLALYARSDGIILVGSVSPDYTASKLFSCVLSGRPILAMFHRASLVSEIARSLPNVFVAPFEIPSDPEFADAVDKGLAWLRKPAVAFSAVEQAVKPWSAEALTGAQCAVFARVTEA